MTGIALKREETLRNEDIVSRQARIVWTPRKWNPLEDIKELREAEYEEECVLARRTISRCVDRGGNGGVGELGHGCD